MSFKAETLPSFYWYDKIWAIIKIELLFIYGRKRDARLLKAKYDFIETIDIYDRNIGRAFHRKQEIQAKRNQVLCRLRKAKEKCLEICQHGTKATLTPEQHGFVLQWEDLQSFYTSLTKQYNAIDALYRQTHHSKLILHETFADAQLSNYVHELTEDLKTAKANRIEKVIEDCNSKLMESASDMNKISVEISNLEGRIDLDNFSASLDVPNQKGVSKKKTLKIETVSDLRAVLLKSEQENIGEVNLLNFEEA